MNSVSIIIANHNYGQYVGEAIQSAFSQTYENIKVGIIDDGSTDNSVKVIEETINGHSNVIFLKNEKATGASAARNRLMKEMWDDTDFFMILDADDLARPNKVEVLLETITKYPSTAVCYGDYTIIDYRNDMEHYESKEPYDFNVLMQRCIVHSNALISKIALESVLENGNVYDEALHRPANSGEQSSNMEDFDLWLRLSKQWMILHVPQDLSMVRVHQENRSNIEKLNMNVVNRDLQYMRNKIFGN